MKIINQTYRNQTQVTSEARTSISELPLTTELVPESLIHIVQYKDETESGKRYESMKMEIGTFENKVYEAVQNTFHHEYWDLHGHDDDGGMSPFSFKDMLDYLGDDAPESIDQWYDGSPEEKVKVNFVKHVNYDFELLRRYIVKKDNELGSEINGIKGKLDELDCMFTREMALFTTTEDGSTTNRSVNNSTNVDDDFCQMSIKSGNKISNEWKVPATGNLVINGWLDSSAVLNNKATASAFCVIEANINAKWEIIGVQGVQPFKNITYVGFTLPVKSGLIIRARTGFTVGNKSGQFSNEQDGFDTLSNSTPNGFKCMVFSNAEYGKEVD